MPLIIAANRDEFYARASAPPVLLDEKQGIYGGRDEVHGGTWLGVNSRGVAAALLNRRTGESPVRSRRSRGLLCMDALVYGSARAAMAALVGTTPSSYNPFNLLVADADEAWVMTNWGGQLRQVQLTPGLHLLTNIDTDDMECPRIAVSTKRFAEVAVSNAAEVRFGARLERSLKAILSDHGTPMDPRGVGPGNALCVHLKEYGTRSSTLLALNADRRWTYRHCSTAPCQGEYEEMAAPSGL